MMFNESIRNVIKNSYNDAIDKYFNIINII